MALGVLGVLFWVLLVSAVILQFLLYKSKDEIFFILNALLGLILSFLSFTALPSNYTGGRILAISWGALAIIAILVKLKAKESTIIGKMILTISILGALVQLMLL